MKKIILSLMIFIVTIVTLMGCKNSKDRYITHNENQEENIEKAIEYKIDSEEYQHEDEEVGIHIKYPLVKDLKDKKNEEKINQIIKERIEEYKKLYDKDTKKKDTIDVTYEIMKMDNEMLSIRFIISLYSQGAAHPLNLVDSITFDIKTGKELQLQELFKENEDYKTLLNQKLKDAVNNLPFELLKEYKGLEQHQEFYLTDNHLVIYYQEYIYTPHAIGPLFLKILLKDLKSILK